MNDKIPEAFLAGGEPVPQGRTRRCLSAVEPSGQSREEEEKEDGFQTVICRRSKAHRAPSYICDPFRRHSWEPGSVFQDAANDPLGGNLQILGSRDPRRIPLVQSQEELETLMRLQDQSAQPQYLAQSSHHPSSGPLNGPACGILSKSVSMSGIDGYLDLDGDENLPQSPGPDFNNGIWGGSCSQLDIKLSGKRAGHSLQRTLSLLWGMTGKAKVGATGDSELHLCSSSPLPSIPIPVNRDFEPGFSFEAARQAPFPNNSSSVPTQSTIRFSCQL
ncbi:uncharacterized protein [Petaurus breviceps papuanus]|uniref:uncharacterized protein isoform X1 n=1 Tax=Petaurus breviceps papuanus TaxID=3040969 RepID=UPI0036D9919F